MAKTDTELAEIFDLRFQKNGECKQHTRRDCPLCLPRWEKAGGKFTEDGYAMRPQGAPEAVVFEESSESF